MRVCYTERTLRSVAAAPRYVQTAFYKQVRFLLADLRHPSLQAKKYDAAADIWQARVTRSWRFYFSIEDDLYTILNVIPHPK